MQLKDKNGNNIFPNIDNTDIVNMMTNINTSMGEIANSTGGLELENVTITIPQEYLYSPSFDINFLGYNPISNEIYEYHINDIIALNGIIPFKKFTIIYTYQIGLQYYNTYIIANYSDVDIYNQYSSKSKMMFESLFGIEDLNDCGYYKYMFIIHNSFICHFTYCLTPDTLITLADGSYKRIDEITYDDIVLGYDIETLELVPQKVIFTDSMVQKSAEEYDVWTLSDGTIIKTVHEHSFYNVEQQKMLHMSEWNIGDHFVKEDGSRPYLVSHKTIKEQTLHYTLGAEQHNFFANGCLSGSHWTKEMHL